MPAPAFNRFHDIVRRTLVRALEQQVLDEMRDAVFFRRLIGRTRLDPNRDRSRPDVGQVFQRNRQPVVQLLDFGRLGHRVLLAHNISLFLIVFIAVATLQTEPQQMS